MKTKIVVLLICGLCCFFACKNENSNKSTRTNGQDYSDYDEAVEGNPGEPIKKWFPKALKDYRLDESTIEMGHQNESYAKAVYVHTNDASKTIAIHVWDGKEPFALGVKNMIAIGVDGTGKEENSELRLKVYLRNGRKSYERIIFQSNQVDISFEVEGRFFVTARGENNTIEAIWEVVDLLNFDALK